MKSDKGGVNNISVWQGSRWCYYSCVRGHTFWHPHGVLTQVRVAPHALETISLSNELPNIDNMQEAARLHVRYVPLRLFVFEITQKHWNMSYYTSVKKIPLCTSILFIKFYIEPADTETLVHIANKVTVLPSLSKINITALNDHGWLQPGFMFEGIKSLNLRR